MEEPWEIRANDSRPIDTLTTFIIFCEDGLCEPYYFRDFEKENNQIKVNTVDNQRSGKLNLNATIVHCSDLGLMDISSHGFVLKPDVPEQIWCVYDRDLEDENLLNVQPQNDVDFTNAIVAAQHTGVHVAWSNDAFELWILLHFEKVPVGQRLHRKFIYDRLTEIFINLNPKTPELLALTSHPLFNYKQSMKKKANFLLHVLPLLKSRRSFAVKNAISLEASYGGNVPYHNCNPCTKVHHLVEALTK